MAGTILFGVDVESADENSLGYARHGADFFRALEVPVTWYLTGQTLEKYPDEFARLAEDPLIELQCHTYSHVLLKTVFIQVPKGLTIHGKTDFFLKPGGTLEQIETELARCEELFERILGRKPMGLTGPWGYYRGLCDRPDILEIAYRHGFRFLRTFARDERDGQPVPFEWQPFFYGPQGFPDVLELMVHGYQDDYYWKAFACPSESERYEDYLEQAARRVAREDLAWSLCSHDHGCATKEGFERKGSWIRALIAAAKGMGIRFLPAGEFYRRKLADVTESGC
jgi:peptidoglycan/xylan/chitin deacetylase (PgdA/CDA1 family)